VASFSQATLVQAEVQWIFSPEVGGSNPGGAQFVPFFLFNIQMFFYIIMKHSITLLHVNKSRTRSFSVSLK
jgi:hypothetical protein